MVAQRALPATTRDGRPILSRAALEAYDPHAKQAGTHLLARCPIHGSDHQRSLHLNIQTGRYRCHACGISGTAVEWWDTTPRQTQPPPSFAERGRRRRQAAAHAGTPPLTARPAPGGEARRVLESLPAFWAQLGRDSCPGRAYLAARGLDAETALAYDAGYVTPGQWPGDGARTIGRLVFPLADPATGATVSALGRLALDADPLWSASVRAVYKTAKQRKLPGCPAGVWPYAALDQARATGSVLYLVEGPADALALLQSGRLAVAQGGTAQVIPATALQGCGRVVLAFDSDDAGRQSANVLALAYLAEGRPATVPPRTWLQGAKDIAELAQRDWAGYQAALGALPTLPPPPAPPLAPVAPPAPPAQNQEIPGDTAWLEKERARHRAEMAATPWLRPAPWVSDQERPQQCPRCRESCWQLWKVEHDAWSGAWRSQWTCITCCGRREAGRGLPAPLRALLDNQ